MRIDYDPIKNQRNIEQRELSFELARDLDWEEALIWQDTRKDYPEPRFCTLALLNKRLHALCFTPIKDGIRVISFRKANAREIKYYESHK
ncbi:BrnT family toxin [Pasteurellaceae bacterium 22721_9_1]